MTATYIYFLKPKKRPGPIKVGCSALPQSRLEIFMAWSPFPLEIIGKVPGTLKDEGFFHRCFADCHSHGEWFRATPRLLEPNASRHRPRTSECRRSRAIVRHF
jgi:hypothetical protein